MAARRDNVQARPHLRPAPGSAAAGPRRRAAEQAVLRLPVLGAPAPRPAPSGGADGPGGRPGGIRPRSPGGHRRSEEHTSELQSLMRISYAVFCLKKKKKNTQPK